MLQEFPTSFQCEWFGSLKFKHCALPCAAKNLSFAPRLHYLALNSCSLCPCLVLCYVHSFKIVDRIFACVNVLLNSCLFCSRGRGFVCFVVLFYYNVKRFYNLCIRGVMVDFDVSTVALWDACCTIGWIDVLDSTHTMLVVDDFLLTWK